MKSKLNFLVGFIALTFFTGKLEGATITIFDNTFALSKWTATGLQGSNFGSVTPSVIGGLSGNGRQLSIPGGGSVTYQIENYKIDQTFSPTFGLANGFSAQVWQQVTGGNSTYQNTRFIAWQGSGFYVAPATWSPPIFTGSWQKFELTALPTDFTLFRGSGPSLLDLSPTGSPISFGYMSYSSVFISGPATPRNSFFNVDITYTPVPEVSTASLLAVAGVWAFGRRRMYR